jgi:copper(I)-binding protein
VISAVRRVGAGVAVAAALATSACAAGQQASTANQVPTLDGTYGSVGQINLRGLNIAAPGEGSTSYPAGSDVAVKLVIVNNARTTDRLSSITSPGFADWSTYATPADADAVVAANSATASPQTDTAAPTAPLPAPNRSVRIQPGKRVSWGTPEAKGVLLLIDTTKKLYPGTSIPVTFRFANAGSVTLTVPVALSSSPNTSPIPEPSTSSIE